MSANKASPASKDRMSYLHYALCERFISVLEKGEEIIDDEGSVVGYRPATAAMVNAISKFLKDNDIAAVLVPGSPLEGIVSRLPTFSDEDDFPTDKMN